MKNNKLVQAVSFTNNTDKKEIKKDIETEPIEFLKGRLTSAHNFGVWNIMRTGIYREMGWSYDLRPFLRSYVYKQYGAWHEVYALNKTNLRKLVSGRIEKVLENN